MTFFTGVVSGVRTPSNTVFSACVLHEFTCKNYQKEEEEEEEKKKKKKAAG